MQIASTNLGSFVIPNAYTGVSVKSTPTGTGVSGNIIIVGEADGGVDFSSEDLKNNFFTPDQAAQVAAKYLKGPIVDAFNALAVPSADADIVGSPNRIYILKTNAGSKASAEIGSYGSMSDKSFGVNGNKYAFTISEAVSEVSPSMTSSVLSFSSPALYDGLSFSVRVNGGAVSVITLGTGSHASLPALISEINGMLPSGLECVAGELSGSIAIKSVVDSNTLSRGFAKSFELIDSTSGDLAALGLVAGLAISNANPQVQVDIVRTDIGFNESFLVDSDVAISIGYIGTSATISIANGSLTTTVSGGVGENLSLNLNNFATLADLASFINSQSGYIAQVMPMSTSTSPKLLDQVSSVGICASGNFKPGMIKKAVANFKSKLSASSKIDVLISALAGLPSVQPKTFLIGGAKGSTLAASVVNAITKCETLSANFIIPLFSRDASADIADGMTESLSTYTIDAIHASVKSHVIKMSSVKMKKNRQAFLSIWDSFAVAKAKASSLANERVSLAFQKTSQINSQGVVIDFMPWHTACIAAGMQAAGFYKGITNKLANVISIKDPSDFDSGSIGDLESALESGLLPLHSDLAGNKFVSDQTTYGLDANFVYNSIQAVYAADLVSLDLTQSLANAFVGKSLADIDAAVIESFIASKMQGYKVNKLIASSSDAPLGFKGLKVVVQGPVASVQLGIKLATTLYFVILNLEISEVSSAA